HLQFLDSQTGGPLGANVGLGKDTLDACTVEKAGRLLAATENGSVQVWDLRNGNKVENTLPQASSIKAISFRVNGPWLFTGRWDGEVQLWDIQTGQRLGEPMPHTGTVKALAVSSDGAKVLVGCWDRWAHLWDLDSRQKLKGFLHQDP